ncbi:MAG: hypothetical protein FWC55_04615 [Firmicutes bacterium]|nr:hypothetical protein [Bacillota bacterium]
MDDILLDTLLHDFYNALLTRRQSEIYELYYLQNLSLSEIAREYGVTPQAVRDILARTRKNLRRYEDALGVVRRHEQLGELRRRLEAFIERNAFDLDVSGELKEAVDFLTLILDN